MMGTLSSGYDPATVAAVARAHGLTEAISVTSARGGEADSGEEIADALEIRLTLIARDAWRASELPEVPFLAADASGGDVFLGGASGMLAGRVLMTGHMGGKTWGRTFSDDCEVARRDHSGLGLTEFRLWEGFLHCPVPYLAIRQLGDIKRISQSPEFAHWDLPPDYSKPLARRMVEEAGVPRQAFGMKKKAGAVLFRQRDSFLTPRSLAEYQRWLAEKGIQTNGEGSAAARPLQVALVPVARGLASVAEMVRAGRRSRLRRAARKLEKISQEQRLFRFVFPWAIEKAMERYRA